MLDHKASFIQTFWDAVQPFVVAGALNSFSQTVLKLAAPGVPDIYQGTEFYDFSLVDPDNRREVDFDARIAALGEEVAPAELLADWRSGRLKAHLTRAGIRLRAEAPETFTKGDYLPLTVEGPMARHVVAFARIGEGGGAAIAIVPRLTLTLLDGQAMPTIASERWAETEIRLPEALSATSWRNVLTGARIGGGTLTLSDVFADLPVALLSGA